MWTYKEHPPHVDVLLLLAVILLGFYAPPPNPSSSFSNLREPSYFPLVFLKRSIQTLTKLCADVHTRGWT